ncbi:hypothetical protein Dsin_016219, partial [Dipteronia sinensis]
CYDGSDEYDNNIRCPNTCVMGGNLQYKNGSHLSIISNLDSIDAKETKNGVNLENLIEKLKGIDLFMPVLIQFNSLCDQVSNWMLPRLKMILILQVVLISFAVKANIGLRNVRQSNCGQKAPASSLPA